MQAQVVQHGAMFFVFFIGTVIWVLALFYIWQDADNLYGTGGWWALFVLVAPLIALPAYWLMKRSTLRSTNQDIAALDRQEQLKSAAFRRSGWHEGPHGEVLFTGDDEPRREGRTVGSQAPPSNFKPFTPRMGPLAKTEPNDVFNDSQGLQGD